MGLFGMFGGGSSSSKDSIRSDIERHKRNIEIAKNQIAREKERVAACKRSKTNYAKDSSTSLINACKQTIENDKKAIARLKKQL